MIIKQPFGKTGHMSTRVIFGSFCLSASQQGEADQVLDLLLEYGINHIDTAPSYGMAEERLGPWMKHHRKEFFLSTKIDKRTYRDAKVQFQQSLEKLQVDWVDLLQLHNLTDVAGREVIMGPGGALEFLVEARGKGLTRFIGITGHGILAPRMHLQSLDRFGFDSVLVPCNYPLMQDEGYAGDFRELVSVCRERSIAIQTIKSIARGYWGDKKRTHVTWYEPLVDEEAIRFSVRWVLGLPDVFLISTGALQEVSKVLRAAATFEIAPSEAEMKRVVQEQGITPLF